MRALERFHWRGGARAVEFAQNWLLYYYLLLEIEEAILVLIEVGEHVEALSLTDVVDHVVLEELVDVVGANLAQLHAVDALEGSPGLETVLLGELLSLLLHNLLVLRDRLE